MFGSSGFEFRPLFLPPQFFQTVYSSVSQTVVCMNPFWHRKISTDRRILDRVNIECPDDMYPKLKIYISELILDCYKYMLIAYVTMHCTTDLN